MLGFLKSFGKQKIKGASEGLTKALVSFDPESATEAQIEELGNYLDKVSFECAKARESYKKEKREADEIDSLYNKRLKAAEIIQTKATEEADPEKKAEYEKGLNELVAMLEEMQPDIEIERQEAIDAKDLLDELEQATKTASDNLKTARKKLEQAAKSMKTSKLRAERAKKQEDQVKVAAGIKKQADVLNVALESMNQQASESNAKAEASMMKVKLLKKTKIEESSIISDALNEASGTPKQSSISDRLSALKR